ncbi:MAG TPA: DNA polymerase/3'-5' exonuclease PolX [Rhodothermales bacterium]
MTNKQIARILRETGALIELTGGNDFRARAYQSASRVVERLEEPATDLVRDERLRSVRGVGPVMAGQIADILNRGSFDLLDELLSAVPAGVVEILRVKGIGAKKARALWKDRGITSLEELEAAAESGMLADLPGFGKRTEQSILENVRLFKSFRAHRRYSEAMTAAAPILDRLRAVEGVVAASFTGEMRRAMEVVSGADFVIAAADVTAVSEHVRAALSVQESVSAEDGVVLTGALPDALAVRIHVVPPDRFGSVLWRTTGSEEHCAAFEEQFGQPATAASEEAIYAAAGIPWIPPELRENRGELDAASRNALPALIRIEDLRGTLHNHSTYSDGANTLRQMAEAARARGLSYFGVCDHSRSLTIANGLSIERAQAQQEEIRLLNEEFAADGGAPFRIFSGTESDILVDGSLDFPDDVLATFDFVVASVHSRFNMTEAEGTARVIQAVRNPYTTILGHATGRLLLSRAGYPIDHEAVIAACAESDTVIEINANPRRLDMDWRWLRMATDLGVLISINPDAHSIEELDNVRWGVAAARKGWLTATQCLNAKTLDEITSFFAARRAAVAGEAK